MPVHERIQIREYIPRGASALNRTSAHAFLESLEAYDMYEIDMVAESNPEFARTADEHGFVPLHKAAWAGDADLAARLLDLGARVDARDAGGNTALHFAAFRGRMAVVRLLLGRGADVDARDGGGRTALFASVFDGNEAVALLLLSSGAKFSDAEGGRFLLAARERRLNGLVAALIDADAKSSAKDTDIRDRGD